MLTALQSYLHDRRSSYLASLPSFRSAEFIRTLTSSITLFFLAVSFPPGLVCFNCPRQLLVPRFQLSIALSVNTAICFVPITCAFPVTHRHCGEESGVGLGIVYVSDLCGHQITLLTQGNSRHHLCSYLSHIHHLSKLSLCDAALTVQIWFAHSFYSCADCISVLFCLIDARVLSRLCLCFRSAELIRTLILFCVLTA